MKALLVKGYQGFGDQVYQRPAVSMLLDRCDRERRDLFLETPLPWIYSDLRGPEGGRVRGVRPEHCRLRTQRAELARGDFEELPARFDSLSINYSPTHLRRELHPWEAFAGEAGFEAESADPGLMVLGPRAIPQVSLPDWAGRPFVLIHAPTIRKEWRNPSRAPAHGVFAAAVRALRARLPWALFVSVGWEAKDEEWRADQTPFPRDRHFEHGELTIAQITALAAQAEAVIAGVSLFLPLALGLRTPALIAFGGSIPWYYLSPMGREVLPIEPDGEPCRCFLNDHDCSKAISPERIEERVELFAASYVRMPRGR